MSTATLPPSRMKPQSRLVTIAEVADLPRTLDGQPVDYELYNGEIVVMAPPAGLHSRHQNRLGRYLSTEAEDAGLGEAFSEAGLILQENPDTLVGFDAAFVLKKSLPVQYHRTGYLLTIPEIVAEIRSKNDWLPEIEHFHFSCCGM